MSMEGDVHRGIGEQVQRVLILQFVRQRLGHRERVKHQRRRDGDVLDLGE